MKTATNRFSNVMKEAVTHVLKENGFKKQGANYYKSFGDISHTINIQRDKNNTKDQINFTINVGVFSNKFWLSEYDYYNTSQIPKVPKELTSIIRERIGEIKDGNDHWYTVENLRLEYGVIKEIKNDINNYILPFLNTITSSAELIQYLKNNLDIYGNDYKLFIMLAEEGLLKEAKMTFDEMKKTRTNKDRLYNLLNKGKKYNFE